MKELGSGLYLGSDGKIYKLVPASREDLEAYIVLSQTKQVQVLDAHIQDKNSVAYQSESLRSIDKFRARRGEDIIGGRED